MSENLNFARDVEITMRDGTILRANVYRPLSGGQYPVLVTIGPYGKDIHFNDFNPQAYARIAEHGPHMNWETPNPDWWVPRGYVLVRVDQRGIGMSPGHLNLFSHQEAEDFYDVIEWTASQEWSNGKVGLLGISYYALTQWQVAALKPPHLTAIVPWEGMVDIYRDGMRHGGIFSNGFITAWQNRQVLPVQNGNKNMSKEELIANRTDPISMIKEHILDDDYYQSVTPDLSQITVPLLSAGNWGGIGLHPRGNFDGFLKAASQHKWLRFHVGDHFTPFYSEEGRAVQERFFDYWLKGIENGLLSDPPVRLAIRKGTTISWRDEKEWPLARTQWTRMYLDAVNNSLSLTGPKQEGQVTYQAPEGGITFLTPPFESDLEVTGPLSLRVWVSTSTTELDLFVTLRNIDQQGNDVNGTGTSGGEVPVTRGWLRASHRKLDRSKTKDYQPYHSHDEIQPLIPGEVVALDVEIWPTGMVFEAGHKFALDLEAHDGVGAVPFLHNDPDDRNPLSLTGTNTIYTGVERASYLLLPIIPEMDGVVSNSNRVQ